LVALADGPGHHLTSHPAPHQAKAALDAFEEVLQSDLLGPLQQWALASHDPVVQNAGLELATIGGLLHRMAPMLHGLQVRQLERGASAGQELLPPKVLEQYLRLTAQFASLLKALYQWKK
jgi:hypothetical protein